MYFNQDYFKQYLALGFQLDSEIAPLLNYWVFKAEQSGDLSFWMAKVSKKRTLVFWRFREYDNESSVR